MAKSKSNDVLKPEKLQKILAQAGIGSRRQMEEWIQAGRILVNGRTAETGMRVTLNDRIEVDGKPLLKMATFLTRPRVVLYHKPAGEICSSVDSEGRKTVFDALPKLKNGRWVMVGRLDYNTSGVLLFTTDGELANRLMHPSYELEREYAVRLFGEVTDDMLESLKSGVTLDDGLAKFDSIAFKGGEGLNTWYHVILREGRNREVRRMWESFEGIRVSRLTRVRYGDIILPRNLSQGKAIELTAVQVNDLRKSVGMRSFTFPKSIYNKNKVKSFK
ncbi:pseudouridine synthase [Thiotrichales bacterium 19S3-7]|nr:pseudouridine synthase [Thiotrichales bacterium 19S3-7]MCF6802318.1 pseudouridine synthase [Thiotrichales bacterium 19S3-11]